MRMDDIFPRLMVSLAIGLLIGLERGWKRRHESAGSRAAGLRTYGICGFLGGISAALALSLGAQVVFAAVFLGFALVFGWFQMQEMRRKKSVSATGAVTGLCVFALGGLAVAGDFRVAAAAGVALAVLLASREALHRLLKTLSWEELRSALILAVMTAIVLPLLPDRTIDPWNGFNPREVWFFTVFTGAISYAGYIATRIAGPARGFLVSALAGSLVSSTAVTVALAHTARSGAHASSLAGAAALAALVSVLRVAGIVLVIQASVFPVIAPAVVAGALALGLCGFFLLSGGGSGGEVSKSPGNPFRLLSLLVFAAGFAAISTLSAALMPALGSSSILVTSGLSGAFDVDVAVLSALRLDGAVVGLAHIGHAVLAGLLANALARLSLAVVVGPRAFWLPLAGATFVALAVAAGAFLAFSA